MEPMAATEVRQSADPPAASADPTKTVDGVVKDQGEDEMNAELESLKEEAEGETRMKLAEMVSAKLPAALQKEAQQVYETGSKVDDVMTDQVNTLADINIETLVQQALQNATEDLTLKNATVEIANKTVPDLLKTAVGQAVQAIMARSPTDETVNRVTKETVEAKLGTEIFEEETKQVKTLVTKDLKKDLTTLGKAQVKQLLQGVISEEAKSFVTPASLKKATTEFVGAAAQKAFPPASKGSKLLQQEAAHSATDVSAVVDGTF